MPGLLRLLILLCSTSLLAQEPPHVVFLAADELPDDLSVVADEGLTLEKFHLTPDPAATSASLLTGRYHYRTGVASARPGECEMHAHEQTLAESLRDLGYRTTHLGHWPHGDSTSLNASAQGFSQVLAAENRCPTPETAEPITGTGFLAGTEPQFLWIRCERLDARGLADWASAVPMSALFVVVEARAPKWGDRFYGARDTVHEGGVRSRCVLRWKGRIVPSSRFRRLTAHIDLVPTVLEILNAPAGSLPLDGESLVPIFQSDGERPSGWPNRLFVTSWTPPGFDTRNASVAVRTDRWLAVREPRAQREALAPDRHGWELYDLMSDPAQRYDVADDFPYLLGELKADFIHWMDHTTDNGFRD